MCLAHADEELQGQGDLCAILKGGRATTDGYLHILRCSNYSSCKRDDSEELLHSWLRVGND